MSRIEKGIQARAAASARALLLTLPEKIMELQKDIEQASHQLSRYEVERSQVCAACCYPLDKEPDTTILVGHAAIWICDNCTGVSPIEVRRRDVDGRVVTTTVSHTRGDLR